MFIDITMFGRSAETANQWLKKGKRILIEGRLVLDQWTDNNGQKRSKHSVVAEKMQFMDNKNENNENQQNNNQNYNKVAQPQQRQAPQTPSVDMGEEDIPF
jgi:single-strand DNA-binding protein